MAVGSTGAGKSATLEGNIKEPGIMLMWGTQVIALLDQKKIHAN
jgi:hypothetical protein